MMNTMMYMVVVVAVVCVWTAMGQDPPPEVEDLLLDQKKYPAADVAIAEAEGFSRLSIAFCAGQTGVKNVLAFGGCFSGEPCESDKDCKGNKAGSCNDVEPTFLDAGGVRQKTCSTQKAREVFFGMLVEMTISFIVLVTFTVIPYYSRKIAAAKAARARAAKLARARPEKGKKKDVVLEENDIFRLSVKNIVLKSGKLVKKFNMRTENVTELELEDDLLNLVWANRLLALKTVDLIHGEGGQYGKVPMKRKPSALSFLGFA